MRSNLYGLLKNTRAIPVDTHIVSLEAVGDLSRLSQSPELLCHPMALVADITYYVPGKFKTIWKWLPKVCSSSFFQPLHSFFSPVSRMKTYLGLHTHSIIPHFLLNLLGLTVF